MPALRRDDPDTWVLELLDTVLGEGMSSRLFLHLREDAGLAYDVHSFITDYVDCGLLGIYAGVDPHDLARALDAILAELSELREHAVPDDELNRAKAYACGRLELRLEEGRNLASWLGAQEALHERTLTLEEAVAEIQAVMPSRSGPLRAVSSRTRRCRSPRSRPGAAAAASGGGCTRRAPQSAPDGVAVPRLRIRVCRWMRAIRPCWSPARLNSSGLPRPNVRDPGRNVCIEAEGSAIEPGTSHRGRTVCDRRGRPSSGRWSSGTAGAALTAVDLPAVPPH